MNANDEQKAPDPKSVQVEALPWEFDDLLDADAQGELREFRRAMERSRNCKEIIPRQHLTNDGKLKAKTMNTNPKPEPPQTSNYICWICKEEKFGNPSYISKSIAGDFHYCANCWITQQSKKEKE